MKLKIFLRFVALILLVLNIFFIFSFSGESASESTKTSKQVTRTILELTYPDFKTLPSEKQDEMVANLHNYFRTIAHFLEFCALGFLLAFNFALWDIKIKKRTIFSIALASLFAIGDEIHQFFVPGRSFQISDILIDSLGATLGAFVLNIANKIIKK